MYETNYCGNGNRRNSKNSQKMKLRITSLIPQNSASLWLVLTLLIWWLGIAGRDIYLVPALVFLGIIVFKYRKGEFLNDLINWKNDYSNKRCLITIYWIHVGLFFVKFQVFCSPWSQGGA